MKNTTSLIFAALLFSLGLSACHSLNNNQSKNDGDQSAMRIGYDDSTLNNRTLPVMMPYNRLIDPAGKVIRFGSARTENHSLDVQLIPNSTLLAVEDRFGITLIDTISKKAVTAWTYSSDPKFRGMMSTYSGIKVRPNGKGAEILWSAANGDNGLSLVMQARWDGQKLSLLNTFEFKPVAPSPLALPNELAINNENGNDFLYVVLNGNNQLVKIDLSSRNVVWTKPTGVAPYGVAIAGRQVYITNWGGPMPGTDTLGVETAGVPYGKTYINPKTGATLLGSVQVFNQEDGSILNDITVGLHPNAIVASADQRFLYVANANSDKVSVIATQASKLVENIPVRLIAGKEGFIGDSPNALAISNDGTTLYVANGLDNAVAVVKLGAAASTTGKGDSEIKGFIPTEAYPGGLLLDGNTLFVTNLEGEGSRVSTDEFKTPEVPAGVTAYNSHHELATLSVIPLPGDGLLKKYTERVKNLNLTFREKIAQLTPRKNIEPSPYPNGLVSLLFLSTCYILLKKTALTTRF